MRRPQAQSRRGPATPLLCSRNEYVLFEPRQLFVIDVFPDFTMELGERRVRAVFLELAQHAVAEAGDQQDFLVGRGVEIDRDEQSSVELRALLFGQRAEGVVEVFDGLEWPLGHNRLR